MKRSFILLIAIFLFIGCDDKVSISKDEYNKLIKSVPPLEYPKSIGKFTSIADYSGNSKDMYIIEMDSCEYIGNLSNSSSDVVTHRGRCKFCAQRKLNGQ